MVNYNQLTLFPFICGLTFIFLVNFVNIKLNNGQTTISKFWQW